MPHQCLKCGSLFAEGTTTILRGCPDCHGTRFFYTKDALTQTERDALLRQSETDLPSIIERVAPSVAAATRKDAPPSVPEKLVLPEAFASSKGEAKLMPDGRLVVKVSKELRQRIERATTGWTYEAPIAAPRQDPPAADATMDAPAATPTPPPSTVPESPLAAEPETVRVDAPGRYEIDVRRLMEHSPIVIQRDGSYTLHLASLFEAGQPKK